MKNLFLDTNIVLDVMLNREEYFGDASKILSFIDKGIYNGYVSSLCFSTIYYILSKHFDKPTALKKLELFRSRIRIASVTGEIIDLALFSGFSDFEDAIQYYSAQSIPCDYIITRNVKDYKSSSLPVFMPSEFISYYLKSK